MMHTNRTPAAWAGNILALLITIAVNALANILPLAGLNTGQVSAKYPSLFTPAGFTFGIWALIYFALTAFVIYQALPAQRNHATIARIDGWFKLSCVANTLWIFAWHYEVMWLSLLFMFMLLASLINIYRALNTSGARTKSDSLLLHASFSLYFGWATVATIANISAVQTAYNWNDVLLSPVAWTVLKLAVAAVIASLVYQRRKDGVYILVFAWAALGICVNQLGTPVVAGAAAVTALYCVVLGVSGFRAPKSVR